MADDAAELGAEDLVEFLALLEEHLSEDVTLVGVGGTGLTLLGAKPSTVDVDFTGPQASIVRFGTALASEPHGFKVDAWPDGTVFDCTLPGDYLDRSRPVDTSLQRIQLRALHPVDIVVTKASRYDARDREDIRRAVAVFKLSARDVVARAERVERVGSADAYRANLAAMVSECFPDDE